MRRKIAVLLVFFIIVITGCKSNFNERVVTFSGKSQNWSVQYTMTGNDELHSTAYEIQYIGQDLAGLTIVNYNIDGPTEGESGEFEPNSEGIYVGKMRSTGDFPSKDSRGITVEIDWNNQHETMVLDKDE